MKLISNSNKFIRVTQSLFSNNNINFKLGFVSYNQLFCPTMTTTKQTQYTIGMDPFCYKQFDFKGPNYIPYPKEEFVEKIREAYKSGLQFKDGYAPFCKHLYVKNFTNALSGSVPITPENEHLLKTGYLSRTNKELPVLSRWFKMSDVLDQIKKAEYLDIILYSREQVVKENTAMNNLGDQIFDKDYYIISIKPQDVEYELPMQPITIMRNALLDEGGSGVSIDHNKYKKSVEYWSKHAVFME